MIILFLALTLISFTIAKKVRTMVKAACIDVTGSARRMDLVWVNNDLSVEHKQLNGEDAVIDWINRYRPSMIAVDAPSGKNLGRTRDVVVRENYGWAKKFSNTGATNGTKEPLYGNMRLCEALLRSRGIGLYNTPPDCTKAAEWIQRGWRLYQRLEAEVGYELWKQPDKVHCEFSHTIIEVHPHACFVVGLGWTPQDKSSLGGQLERAAYIRHQAAIVGQAFAGVCIPTEAFVTDLAQVIGVASWESIRTGGIKLPCLSHDTLDALAGIITAMNALTGNAYAVGDPSEGVIVLPSKPKDSTYRRLN